MLILEIVDNDGIYEVKRGDTIIANYPYATPQITELKQVAWQQALAFVAGYTDAMREARLKVFIAYNNLMGDLT